MSVGNGVPTAGAAARGYLACVSLVLLVAVVPVVLVLAGGAPGAGFAHGGLVWFARGTGVHVSTDGLAHGVLTLAWLVWLWLVVCVVAEVGSRATGRTPVQLPHSRAVQALVACLVGASLAVALPGRGGAVPRAPRPVPATLLSVAGDQLVPGSGRGDPVVGDQRRTGAGQGAVGDPSPVPAVAAPPMARGEQRMPVVPVGAGVLGVGVVNLLERMRRAQQRHRVEGGLIRLPEGGAAAFEGRLRAGDGRQVVASANAATRLFAQRSPDHDHLFVRSVLVGDVDVELTVEGLHGRPVPVPFTLGTRPGVLVVTRVALERWSSGAGAGQGDGVVPAGGERGVEGSPGARPGGGSPCPTLVTVGRGPDGVLLVNLEALGSIALVGDPAACEGVVRALAVELATSRWSDQFDLLLVGFGAELERFGRVEAVASPEDLVPGLRRRRFGGRALLQGSGFSSFTHARAVEESSAWDPLVVLCGPSCTGQGLSDLVDVASDRRTGVAVVVVGDRGDVGHRLEVPADASARLDVLGTLLRPQRLDATDLATIDHLVRTASDRTSVSATTAPYRSLAVALPRGRATTAPCAHRGGGDGDDGRQRGVRPLPDDVPGDGPMGGPAGVRSDGAPGAIVVRVLGPVEIVGAARPFTRVWARELVIYLAMHPGGASNDAWATALWPDRAMAPSTLHSTASVARRSLGQDQHGSDHLPRSHGRLALAGSVATDWSQFVSLVESGEVSRWRQALELVVGRPFDGLRAGDWPVLEGIAPAVEAAVVDVAGRLAGAYLRRGDAAGAEWAARKGLLVSPYDERLYRMLLRAADGAGNPAGVESVMSELIRLVADGVEPYDAIHPTTMELYRSLTRRRSPPGPRGR